jgi:hypothetical protein
VVFVRVRGEKGRRMKVRRGRGEESLYATVNTYMQTREGK